MWLARRTDGGDLVVACVFALFAGLSARDDWGAIHVSGMHQQSALRLNAPREERVAQTHLVMRGLGCGWIVGGLSRSLIGGAIAITFGSRRKLGAPATTPSLLFQYYLRIQWEGLIYNSKSRGHHIYSRWYSHTHIDIVAELPRTCKHNTETYNMLYTNTMHARCWELARAVNFAYGNRVECVTFIWTN